MKKRIILLVLSILAVIAFFFYNSFIHTSENRKAPVIKTKQIQSMKITSAAFQEGQTIPKQFTCEGDNYNPPLTFADIPHETKSLALIVEDPDTPTGTTWYHWLVYNIPPQTSNIEQNTKPQHAIEGLGSGGNSGYAGPCPPNPKPHRYIFTLYALDQMFDVPSNIDVPKFREAIQGHILEETQLIGLYTGPATRAK